MYISLFKLPHVDGIFRDLFIFEIDLFPDLALVTFVLTLLGVLIIIFASWRMPWSFPDFCLCCFGNNRKGKETVHYKKMDRNREEVRSTRASRLRDKELQVKREDIERKYEINNYTPTPPKSRPPRSSNRTRRGNFRPPSNKTYQSEKSTDKITVTSESANVNANTQFPGNLSEGNSARQERKNSLTSRHLSNNSDMHNKNFTVVPQADSSLPPKTISQTKITIPAEVHQTVEQECRSSHIPYVSTHNSPAVSLIKCGERSSSEQLKVSLPVLHSNHEEKNTEHHIYQKHSSFLSTDLSKDLIHGMSDKELRRKRLNETMNASVYPHNPTVPISDAWGGTSQMVDQQTIPTNNAKSSLDVKGTINTSDSETLQTSRSKTLLNVNSKESQKISTQTCRKCGKQMKPSSVDTHNPDLNITLGSHRASCQEQQEEYVDIIKNNKYKEFHTSVDSTEAQQTVRSAKSMVSSAVASNVNPNQNDAAARLKLDSAKEKVNAPVDTPQECVKNSSTGKIDSCYKKNKASQQNPINPKEQLEQELKNREKTIEKKNIAKLTTQPGQTNTKSSVPHSEFHFEESNSENLSRGILQEVQNLKIHYLKTKYLCSHEQGLDIYKPLLEHSGHAAKIQIGDKNNSGPEKVILLVGGAGSGKTTWINGLVNYIYGTEWDNNYRLKLIDERKPGQRQNQAKSQTKNITSYTVHPEPWFRIPFTVTVIDTPGFGDTEGIQKDNEIKAQIGSFFTSQEKGGVDHIDAIGFVVQSSLVRLAPSQRYVFNSILSLFGKDIANNIFLFLTFADVQKPQVLSGINEAAFPYKGYFKFNNSVLYVNNKEETSNEGEDGTDKHFDRMFWKMGTASYRKFLTAMESTQSKSLALTNEVLRERQRLEANIDAIHQKIKISMTKQEELAIEKEAIKLYGTHDDRNFDYETPKVVLHKIETTNGLLATNCLICQHTCHRKCSRPKEHIRECCVMKEGYCTSCPERCYWNLHSRCNYIYYLGVEKVTRRMNDLKTRYKDVTGQKRTPIEIIESDLLSLKIKTSELIEEARNSFEKLREKALRPNPLSTIDYIDLMIQEEEHLAGPGWRESVRQLEKIKKEASIMKMIQSDKSDVSAEDQSVLEKNEGTN